MNSDSIRFETVPLYFILLYYGSDRIRKERKRKIRLIIALFGTGKRDYSVHIFLPEYCRVYIEQSRYSLSVNNTEPVLNMN